MIIRVSERGTFKRCRKRWDYSSPNRQKLTSLGSPVALTFGSMIHKTHEIWLDKPNDSPDEIFMKVAKDQLEDIKRRYNKATGTFPSEVELESFYDHVILGRDMINNYAAKWGSPLPKGFTLVKQEQKVQVPIPGTEHILQGTFDGLIMNDRNTLFILERKTYSNRPRLDNLNNNDQFLAYIWLLTQLMKPFEAKIGGMYYDGMWKRKLEGKRTLDDLFFREILIRPPEEVEQFGRYLQEEVRDMTREDVGIYLNRRWEGCYDCPFEKLCTAESKGEDADYVRRTFYTVREDEDEEGEESDFTATSS